MQATRGKNTVASVEKPPLEEFLVPGFQLVPRVILESIYHDVESVELQDMDGR